jgi:hypothetical protein
MFLGLPDPDPLVRGTDLDPDSDPSRNRIQITDPDPGGQKLPTKIEKSTELSCFEVLDVFF